ncbi:hypothetical protein P691DRAFT_375321 [Macrolepiota fuliginosa MF-IS2]|uniref:Uncharacterized protein n=1 Tax=Macrolepiota fuliginosa MF-IS2 TaxID=1400762 RepID=A0A9P6BZV2_9AGAR|nr:hypothetical protein P691DRAFT_375321 [Macrolepiota fuliginosa MF-IS2]
MQDPQHSRQLCIQLKSGLALRSELTQRLRAVSNGPDIEPYRELHIHYMFMVANQQSTIVTRWPGVAHLPL